MNIDTYADGWTSLALALINTWDPYFPQPERLPTPADLARFLGEHGLVAAAIGETDLAAARRLRARLREVVEAPDAAAAAAALNALLAEGAVTPWLAIDERGHGRLDLLVAPSDPPLRQLGIQAALGLAAAIARFGRDRLRTCASPPCREAFLDTSRNGARRFCSDRCANRYNVAAFRARRRVDGEG